MTREFYLYFIFRLEKVQSSEGADVKCPSSETESEEELVIEGGVEGERWDCESILSTYSNLYNHPTLIEATSSKQAKVIIVLHWFVIINHNRQGRRVWTLIVIQMSLS